MPVYEAPEELPDGSFYQAWRVEGRFVQPLILERYPLDRHNLNILVENSVYTTDQLVYVADGEESWFFRYPGGARLGHSGLRGCQSGAAICHQLW